MSLIFVLKAFCRWKLKSEFRNSNCIHQTHCSIASNSAPSEICQGITWYGTFTLPPWCKQGSSQETVQCKHSKQETNSSDRSRTQTRVTPCRLCINGGMSDACPTLPRGPRSLYFKKYMQQSNALRWKCLTSGSHLRKATLKVIAKQHF